MRASPHLFQAMIDTIRRLASAAVPAVVIAVTPATMADTVAERLAEASSGLFESTPKTTPPLILARARGHLDALAGRTDAAALAAQGSPRARLAWIEAVLSSDGLGPGATRAEARAATRRGLDLLAEAAPDDEAVILDRTIAKVLAGEASLDAIPVAAWTTRPFTASPDAVCDRLVAGGEAIQAVMLDRADRATQPAVVAAILANGDATTPLIAERIAALDHGYEGIGCDVVFELARRDAGAATAAYILAHPEATLLPGVRVAAITAIAPIDPTAAIEALGDESVIDRLPARGQTAVRLGLARGLADTDPDAALMHADLAGQLDDRIEALLAIRRPETDPDRTLEDIKSCRTLAAGRLIAALEARRLLRTGTTGAVADLFRTGRYDLAYSLLVPNTTEPTRPADQWLPTRIAILSDALAAADAAPDAWIPLMQSVTRIGGVDGQIEALSAIARGVSRVLPPDADLPEPLRGVLSDTLVEIALRG